MSASATVCTTRHPAGVAVVVMVVVITVQELVVVAIHSATGAATPREKREARMAAVCDFIFADIES
jgi:hypothetical protein